MREALRELAEQEHDVDRGEELARWERVRGRAPKFWERSGVRSIVETVASAWVKKQLDLGP